MLRVDSMTWFKMTKFKNVSVQFSSPLGSFSAIFRLSFNWLNAAKYKFDVPVPYLSISIYATLYQYCTDEII